MTLEFVHYRIKIKVGVTLQCKVAMHNKYMSKLPRVSLFNFLSHVFAKYYLNWFTDGKVITKTERVNSLLRHSMDMQTAKRLEPFC